jgi:hypothetical protein
MYSKRGLYFKIPNIGLKDISISEHHYGVVWGGWIFIIKSKKIEQNKKFTFTPVLA